MTTTTENQTTQAQWDDANRFLDQLFIDPMLANNYQQISQQANGQDNAPEILTSWLQEQGYDTTPDLVYAALINLQNTSLGYWTGIYGQSFLENSQPAPVLAIAPNTEGNTVAYLNGVELKNFVFESVETDNVFHPTLSWDLENNETAGHITFYYTPGVTLDLEPPTGYTGNWFEGTLQTSVSSVSQKYYGAIGEPTDSSAIPQLILADGEGESFWDKYSTYVYVGIGAIAFVVSAVIIATLIYRNRRVDDINFEQAEQRLRETWSPDDFDFAQQSLRNRDFVTKTTDQWIPELLNNRKFVTDAQKLAFTERLNRAKERFQDKLMTKGDLLDFTSFEALRELNARRYFGEELVTKISEKTGISPDKISPLLDSSNQQGLSSDLEWQKLMNEGFRDRYLGKPQTESQNYDRWLQNVKDKLRDASVNAKPSEFLENLKSPQPVQQPGKPDVSKMTSKPQGKSNIDFSPQQIASTNQQGKSLNDQVIEKQLENKEKQDKQDNPSKNEKSPERQSKIDRELK